MLSPDDVSAVIVTRGDVDLSEIIRSLDVFREVIIWDNSEEQDLAVYGRYAAIERTNCPVIYVQDDDCVLAPESFERLLAAYEPGKVIANMPPEFRHAFYTEHCLVGFGAIFDRDLPERAHRRFFDETDALDYRNGDEQEIPLGFPRPTKGETRSWLLAGEFVRTCDVVFTALTPRKLVWLPYRNLEHATAPGRMYRTPGHVGERQRMLELALKVRDAGA